MDAKTGTNENGCSQSPGLWTAWLLGDACIFGLALYKAIEYALLRVDGVIGAPFCAIVIATMFFTLFALRRAYVNMFGGKLWGGLIAEWIVMGGLTALVARVSLVQRKTQSFNWLPLEWHKIIDNHMLLVRISPLFAALMAAVVVFGVWMFVTRKRWALLGLLAVAVALTAFQCSIMTKEAVYVIYFIMYIAPLLVAMLATGLMWPRMGARTLVYCGAALTLLWHYIGWAPVIYDKSFTKMPGVERLYPAEGRKSEFPLAFFRDFQTDPDKKFLFTAYGPTSGIIRLDLATKKLTLLDTPDALVRYIALDPQRGEFFAMDWINSDMLTLSMSTMAQLKREDVYFKNDGLFVPVYFFPYGGKLYATYSERPGLAELSVRPVKLERKLLFRDIGLTKFRSGAWKAALDPVARKIFVEIGMTDLRNQFLIARVDIATFQVDGKAGLPNGGLELTAIPERRRIIATDFFSTRMYEYDMDTMQPTRELRGPRSCRNLVYDARRNLLYGTGFLSGDLLVIDYDTGRTLFSTSVGNKAASLYITPDDSELFLGSSWGIFRVNLDRFLSQVKKPG